ncbi:MAG: hypothetical protein JXB17_08275, partial [Bacteroidales bacterium]|nr:hypothetical protein [Bacteroidales bacterium]
CFILINEILRNGGKASFFDFEIIYTDEPSFKINGVNCIKTLLFRIIIETIYKVSLKTVSFGNTVTNAIGEKFFCEHKKNNLIVNEIRREYYDIVFTLSKTFHLDTVNYQHVFIDQSFPNDSIIDNIKLNSIKKFLFEINNLSIKPHPGHKHSNIYNNERIIPEFIPAELIFNNIECSIISIYSSVLFSASKIPGLRIISILPIVVKTDHDYTLYKDILIEKTNNRIELIYDIDDLLSILTRLQHRL